MHPPLRNFRPRAHRLVLFDEASATMVRRNRRLFQAPNVSITIGTSPTNRDAYEVYLNDTLLVICSNSWKHQLDEMGSLDADWIKSNQVYVEVTSPLWMETSKSAK